MRKVLFWTHLAIGTTAGLLVLNMAVTGALLAFEPQLTAWVERDRRLVVPPADGARRWSVAALAAKARGARPGIEPAFITLRADPTASALVGFGREGGPVYLNPYTGEVLGGESRLHAFLHGVEDWHRWLGKKEIGKPITGAACAAFFLLLVSGLILWAPRAWTRAALTSGMLLNPRLSGKARDWNWHNVAGFWCSPLVLATTLTGLVIAYPWANDLLYRLAGSRPPARQGETRERAPAGGTAPAVDPVLRPGKLFHFSGPIPATVFVAPRSQAHRPAPSSRLDIGADSTPINGTLYPVATLDALWAKAEAKTAGWTSIQLRLPRRPGDKVSASIEEPSSWGPVRRSQLTWDPSTLEELKWEPASAQDRGRKWRSWVVPIHTGRAWGVPGQLAAGAASAGAMVLVWTGLAMAWRRLGFVKK